MWTKPSPVLIKCYDHGDLTPKVTKHFINTSEKHFIINSKLKTYDSSFSITPPEFKLMVRKIRDLELAMGSSKLKVTKAMKSGRKLLRSLYFVKSIKKNEKITNNNVRSIRPGGGLAPKYIKRVLSKKAKKDIKFGTPVSWKLVN